MVGSLEPDHLEHQGLLLVIGGVSKHHEQVDLPEQYCLLSRHDVVEGSSRGSEAGPVDPHRVKGVGVEDVEAAASVHENFCQALGANNRVDH